MTLRRIGYALGAAAIAAGTAQLLAGRPIARRLGIDERADAVRALGLREAYAGAMLFAGPKWNRGPWLRVAGDLLDLGALALASRLPRARRTALLRSSAFATAALLADIGAATVLDRKPVLERA